jgi:integrase
MITFKKQAEQFLKESTQRKRDPIRPKTYKVYKYAIYTHLIPIIGDMSLQDVGNKAVKEVVEKLAQQGLKPATIQLIRNVIKQIRASALNSEGEQLYPYVWNEGFIDAPQVDPNSQKAPIASAQAIQEAVLKSNSPLIALLAGTGLRINEALALEFDDKQNNSVWFPSESKIIIRNQRIGNTFGPPKTKAGVREVDLAPELNSYLIRIIKPEGQTGFIFLKSESAYRAQLAQFGIPGFHSLRRFRVTHMRLNGVPEALVQFWTGHAAGNITERYTKVGEEIEARKTHAKKAGLGFELPLS